MADGLWKWIQDAIAREWAEVKRVPLTLAAVFVFGLGFSWWASRYYHSDRIDGLKERIAGLNDELRRKEKSIQDCRNIPASEPTASIGQATRVHPPLASPAPAATSTIKTSGRSGSPMAETERIFVAQSPTELMRLYNDNTSVQADKLFEAYVGKWMTIWVEVREVREIKNASGTWEEWYVTGTSNDMRNSFFGLYFDSRWKEQLGILARGQNVEIVGRIARASWDNITYEDCELRQVLPAHTPTAEPSATKARRARS